MTTQSEIAGVLRAVAEQQQKTIGEIRDLQTKQDALTAKIAELQALIAQGGEVTQELSDAVQAVKDLSQQVDDAIPDLPTPVEPPAEAAAPGGS